MEYYDPLNARLVLPFQRPRDRRSTLPILPSLPQLKRTDQLIVFQHRDHHVGPNAAEFDGSNYPRIASFNVTPFFSKIGCVDYIFVCHHSAHGVFRTKAYPLMPSQFEKGHRCVMSCDVVQKFTVPSEDVAKSSRLAKCEPLSPTL